jgi:ketosteroid isomerase-like protein
MRDRSPALTGDGVGPAVETRRMATTIDHAFARRFATEWIAAWNAGDLERIFQLYRDDFEMRSPLIAERGFAPSGVLRGKQAIRPYWGAGIANAAPPLRFELIDAYPGIGTVAVHYRSVGRRYVIEIIELDDDGLGVRGCACHGAVDGG